MTQKELLKKKELLTKKDAQLLRIKCTYTILNLQFMELCMTADKHTVLSDLREKFAKLVEDLLKFD